MVIADIEWIDIKKALPKLNDGGRAVTVYMLLKRKNVGTPNIFTLVNARGWNKEREGIE